jgi:hypothetical protein
MLSVLAHTGCGVFQKSSHSCKRDDSDEITRSVKTRKTNHNRMYLPKRVTSHPQSWSCSAVWARFCGSMHRLYMPSVWHLTIAMTRDGRMYCHLLRLNRSHWLKCLPALSLNAFPSPRPMVSTPQIAISDIIVGDSSVRASVARAVYSSAKHGQPKANRLARKENPLSPKNDLKHLVSSPSSPLLRPWSR